MNRRQPEIVVVDDDPLTLQAMEIALSGEYEVHCFAEPDGAEIYLMRHPVALAVLDLHLSGCSGLEVLERWKKKFPDVEVVFCSGETRVEQAIECLKRGASDYLVKPFGRDDLLFMIRRTLEKSDLRRNVEALRPMVLPHPVEFVGQSKAMRDILDKISRLKHQTHLTILIIGESGTGKEIVARLLHQQEADPRRPFVIVNMPAIPAALMEAELFGVSKGAYTDAKVSRAGRFELAEGGDIFLDEIGDLPLEAQAKLLRTLQDRQVERLGESRPRRIDFRVISATNQPLGDLVRAGRFREDLLYRLSDIVLSIPPLAERPEDIVPLAEFFLKKYAFGRQPPSLSDVVLTSIKEYHWPGNVRQLESAIKRALVFQPSSDMISHLEVHDLLLNPAPNLHSSKPGKGTFETQMEDYEKRLISSALRRNGGHRERARIELGLSRATFYRKLSHTKERYPSDLPNDIVTS